MSVRERAKNMDQSSALNLKAPHVFSWVVLATCALLVWWGAAVTTEDVGLAVPDWPLSYKQVNPEGWLGIKALRLEHGHRSIATLVGLLTAALFLWVWVRFQRRWNVLGEFAALLVVLAAIVVCVSKGYYIQQDAAATGVSQGNSTPWFIGAGLLGGACLFWLGWCWHGRGWPIQLRLCALALIVVELQAILGGLRVTEMSDSWAIIHGCLGQLFFCLLLLITVATSQRWKDRTMLPTKTRFVGLVFSYALFFGVLGQLILGATVRHTHRFGIAAKDIITTGGKLYPGFENFDLGILFSHKGWALVVACIAVGALVFFFRNRRETPGAFWNIAAVVGLIVVQIGLGVGVVATEKSFWVTNIHVLTGLSILAASALLLIRSQRTHARSVLIAGEVSAIDEGSEPKGASA